MNHPLQFDELLTPAVLRTPQTFKLGGTDHVPITGLLEKSRRSKKHRIGIGQQTTNAPPSFKRVIKPVVTPFF